MPNHVATTLVHRGSHRTCTNPAVASVFHRDLIDDRVDVFVPMQLDGLFEEIAMTHGVHPSELALERLVIAESLLESVAGPDMLTTLICRILRLEDPPEDDMT